MDEGRAFECLRDSDVAVLTTIRPDGRPRPVPIVFAVLEDRRIVTAVDHKPKSTRRLSRLADIDHDPRVSLLCHHYEDDWDRLWWVRVDGRAQVFLDASPATAEGLIARYRQYDRNPPEGPWIVISPETVVSWP